MKIVLRYRHVDLRITGSIYFANNPVLSRNVGSAESLGTQGRRAC